MNAQIFNNNGTMTIESKFNVWTENKDVIIEDIHVSSGADRKKTMMVIYHDAGEHETDDVNLMDYIEASTADNFEIMLNKYLERLSMVEARNIKVLYDYNCAYENPYTAFIYYMY